MYYDWLKVLVLEGKDPPHEAARLRHFKTLAGNTGEFLWKRTLLFLSRDRHKSPSLNKVTKLRGAPLPDEVEKVLEKGPKYSFQPRLERLQQLAMTRSLGDKASDDARRHLIAKSAECVIHNFKKAPRLPLKKIASYMKYN